MNTHDLQNLYNYWAAHRILSAAVGISPEQFTAPTSHSYGSLLGTQHQSEAAVLLTDCGHLPGGLDFTLFLNEYPG